jgi:hypothetical protein
MKHALVAFLVLTLVACRTPSDDDPRDKVDITFGDSIIDFDATQETTDPPDLTGNERWIRPPGTARVTFAVDDRANKTFEDGQIIWTGSFVWNHEDNTIAYASSWLPTDGPYPLLYDDGPISLGGHEMEGAVAGDHIFTTEVYVKAEEELTFDYGALNELLFWMWEGPNGQFTVSQGSTDTIEAKGMTLRPFGHIDVKVTVDLATVHPTFDYVNEWSGVKVYVKGSMNMWTPIQILDAGPEINKGDEVAGDGLFTFVHGLNLGAHTGLLQQGQEAQFTVMFSKEEETWESAVEYKMLSGGIEKGVAEGVEAFISCDGRETWVPADMLWRKNSWGNAENTTVAALCDGEPECTPDDDQCGDGRKCVDYRCVDWCDLDTECDDGEKCKNNQCVVWCDLDTDCDDGEKCRNNQCVVWCDLDTECDDGEKCKNNQCVVWCDLDAECDDGEKCKNNQCVVWCDQDAECGDGKKCVNNQCKPETVLPSTPTLTGVAPQAGPEAGGTLVTLTGTDFRQGATVTFGGLAASFVQVHSEIMVTCTTPAHAAGMVKVVITNTDSGSASLTDGFVYEADNPGTDPIIHTISPAWGTVLGGTQVMVTGLNFHADVKVLLDGVEMLLTQKSSSQLRFTTPAHARGPVSLEVRNPDNASAYRPQGYYYTLYHTPDMGQELSTWPAAFRVATNTLESSWGPALNRLDALYVAYDNDFLYIGVTGVVEDLNYILGYLDVNAGVSAGVADMTTLDDNSGNGNLDDALSSVLNVTVAGFGAEFGFGLRGNASYQAGGNLADSQFAGWRELTPPTEFPWLQGTAVRGVEGVRFSIPRATILPAGTGPHGANLALFVRLTNGYGTLDGLSNQSLPQFYQAGEPGKVGAVVDVHVK